MSVKLAASEHRCGVERARSVPFALLIGALTFIPYFIWAHYLLGNPTIFGKAVFLTAITVVLVTTFVLNIRRVVSALGGTWLLTLWAFFATVLVLRSLLYNEGIAQAVSARFGFLFFVYVCATLPFVDDARRRAVLRRVIVWNAVVQASFGIVHRLYFPYVVTGIAIDDSGQGIYFLDPGLGGYRENGTVLSANTYGAYLVLGLIFIFARIRTLDLRAIIRLGPIIGLLYWGIALSGSRYALGSALLLTIVFLLRSLPAFVSPGALVLALVVALSSDTFSRVQQRNADEGSGSRGAKTALALDVVAGNISSVLLGPPNAEIEAARTPDGEPFSDNSYASILLACGVPLAAFFFCFTAIVWSSLVRMRGWVAVTAVFVLGQMAVTNAIFWDGWIVYAGATLLVLHGDAIAGAAPRRLCRAQRRRAATGRGEVAATEPS